MNYRKIRKQIQEQTNSRNAIIDILNRMGIDVTRSNHFKVREERTPSTYINQDGSCYDYGTGNHYGDIVSLIYDGYSAFDSLHATMEWLCHLLGINLKEIR